MRPSTGLVVVVTALGAGYVSGRYQNTKGARVQAEYEASVSPPPARQRLIAGKMPLRDAMPAASPQRQEEALSRPAARPSAPAAILPPLAGAPTITADSMKSLVADPLSFMAQKTWLGKPAGFQKFAADPQRVNRYVSNPIVKNVLDSPILMKKLLSNEAVVRAFLSSPAMRDPAALKALSSSPLIKRLAESKGVQAVLADPVLIQRVLMSPQTMTWMTSDPQAARLFSKISAG